MKKHADDSILPSQRQAGVCLHISSLPGEYGIGEIGEQAHAFIDTISRMQLSTWQFLPLGPTAFGNSPYQPLSTFAGNEMLIDINDLYRKRLVTRRALDGLSGLPAGYVDFARLIPAKSAVLHMAGTRFDARAGSRMKAAFDRFVAANDKTWLHDYAMFRVLKSLHDEQSWTTWPAKFAHRDRKALRNVESEHGGTIHAMKVVQFLFHDQWRRLREHANKRGVRLFGDMPIYIALDSADAWANRDILQIDASGRPGHVAGVPPDYFSEDGQLWGNPLYDWNKHAAHGYRWWIDRLSASLQFADIVRVDHFRGFESYWSVPAAADTARDGAWKTGPGDALFTALRNSLGSLPLVAENLGVITPEVEALRERHQLPGMVVLQFAVADDDFSPEDVIGNCVCYTGTHDNDTTLGWFRGSPGDLRPASDIRKLQKKVLALTGGTAASIAMDMVELAFSTAARLAIVPLQDLLELGSEARFNTPGGGTNNWQWRVTDAQLTRKLCARVARAVHAAGRDPASGDKR